MMRLFHTSVAREPCKCGSRAVQVSLASHASVVREPCRPFPRRVFVGGVPVVSTGH